MKNNQFDNNKYNELLSIFNHDEKQSNVFMTNEYFEILPKLFTDENKWKFTTFSYAYLYLNTYMYRWSTYGQYIPKVNEIKEILGLYGNDKRYNDVIKKDGILDAYGLTETVGFKDMPIVNIVDEFEELKFDLVSDIFPDSKCEVFKQWKQARGITPKTTIKKPVLALHSNIKKDDNEGTFYEPINFTNIPFEVFAFCMSKKDLGFEAFFVYSYIKNGIEKAESHKETKEYNGEFQTSHRIISKKFGAKLSNAYNILISLIKHGLIERYLGQDVFSLAVEDTSAPTFEVFTEVELFDKQGSLSYDKARVLTINEYEKEIKNKKTKESEIIDNLLSGIDLDQLLF